MITSKELSRAMNPQGQDLREPKELPFNRVDHPGPIRPEFASVDSRLLSFKDWPQALPQSPKRLAEAGFVYVGWWHQLWSVKVKRLYHLLSSYMHRLWRSCHVLLLRRWPQAVESFRWALRRARILVSPVQLHPYSKGRSICPQGHQGQIMGRWQLCCHWFWWPSSGPRKGSCRRCRNTWHMWRQQYRAWPSEGWETL